MTKNEENRATGATTGTRTSGDLGAAAGATKILNADRLVGRRIIEVRRDSVVLDSGRALFLDAIELEDPDEGADEFELKSPFDMTWVQFREFKKRLDVERAKAGLPARRSS